MKTDVSIWTRYQPGFVDPTYVPYLKTKTVDYWGNQVEINSWKKDPPKTMVQPELIRINKGLRFQRMFEEDPCPVGWQKDTENIGYCTVKPLRHEPVFYTGKAFIAERQFFDGPADSGGVRERNEGHRRISEQTDLRSVNPLTGEYQIYYEPVQSSAKNRYVNPVPPPVKYDTSWNEPRQSSYAKLSTSDSYL